MSRLSEALAALEARAEASIRDGMARYGIETKDRVIGVRVAGIQQVAKALGRDHDLAEELWQSGVYEARMLAAFVDDPALVTPERMDRWARGFDNWAGDEAEFVKRTAFALLASLALHDKKSSDQPFLDRLPLVETAAKDERNFVKKGVSWALRSIGGKKSPLLRAAARKLADRLTASSDKAAKWVGRDAQRAFAKADL